MKKKLWTFLWITIGVLLISVAYYFFLEPSKLVTGGVTGLMIMLEPFLPFPPSILMYILNISLLLIGYLVRISFLKHAMHLFYHQLLF